MSCLRKNNENFIAFCNRLLGIKPCGLGARIQDVKAFFIQNTIFLLYLIVCDCMVYHDPKFLIFETKKCPNFFSEAGG